MVRDVGTSLATSAIQRGIQFAGDKAWSGFGKTAVAESAKGFGGKALSALKPFAPAYSAPIALVLGTAEIGRRSLDVNYEETVETQADREKSFYDRVGGERREVSRIVDTPEGFKIEEFLTDQVITFIGRKLRTQTERGISRS